MRLRMACVVIAVVVAAWQPAWGQAPSLTASPNELAFQILFGTPTSSQQFALSSTGANLNFTASASVVTPAGINWLSVSPLSGTTPATLTVTVIAEGLAPGYYSGSVRVTATGAANSPLVVPVGVTVFGDRQITLNNNVLQFTAPVNGPAAPQSINVFALGIHAGELEFNTAITPDASKNWLAVTPSKSITPRVLTVTANGSGMTPGTFLGTIAVSDTAGLTRLVQVLMTVSNGAFISPNPDKVNLFTQAGSDPEAQTVQLSNAGNGTLGWSATATTTSGGSWLSVSPTIGNAPTAITISANAASLPKGTYNGTVRITAAAGVNALNSPRDIPVTLKVGVPSVGAGGVINNASYISAGTSVAPGSIAAVFGTNLTDGRTCLAFEGCNPTLESDGKLSTTMAGTQVKINGTPVPIFYAVPLQLGVQMPANLAGTTAIIEVSAGGQTSALETVFVSSIAPGIFSMSSDGQGQGAIIHATGTLVSPSQPAQRNEIVIIFATGLGAVTPPLATGVIPGNSGAGPHRAVAPVTVKIDGIEVEPEFAGLAGCCAGLNQINVRIPQNARTGNDIAVQVIVGGMQSNPVTIGVR